MAVPLQSEQNQIIIIDHAVYKMILQMAWSRMCDGGTVFACYLLVSECMKVEMCSRVTCLCLSV